MLLGSSAWCLIAMGVAVIVLYPGRSHAQDTDENTMTIDLSDPSEVFDRTFKISRVQKVRALLPLGSTSSSPCPNTTATNVCFEVMIPSSKDSVTLEVVLVDRIQRILTMSIDDRFGAGCRTYMHPQNATVGGSPVTLTCDPFFTDTSMNDTEPPNVVWRQFQQEDDLQSFINDCFTDCEGNCTERYNTVNDTAGVFRVGNNSLTVEDPVNNQAWFVPSVEIENCIYVAPMTFLYRWPIITTHYEFSLDVGERTKDYRKLICEANSFPPATMEWRRSGENFNDERYSFENITTEGQLTVNGRVIISEVNFDDSAVFTCVALYEASLPTNVSLDVRLRVKSRLRPLWPAIGIVVVGVIVSLFIIIGHFVDKAIEKHQNEPSNPVHHKRLQSITSTMDNENSSNNLLSGKHSDQTRYSEGHLPVKRLSSARMQLLEESQC